MQISIEWLSEYLDLDGLDAEAIAKALTSIGLEVEAIETRFALPDGVVIAKILEASRHPSADRLQVCKVQTSSSGETLQIVCGAPNARAGLLVALALPGTTIGGQTIKVGKIRDVESHGMLCSESELGLSEESSEKSNGIIELEEASQSSIGKALSSYYGKADTVLTLNITPNRADCLSVIGVARDLAAKLGKAVRSPLNDDRSVGSAAAGAEAIQVEIADPELCQRFVALGMKGEKLGSLRSPYWLRRRLLASGMRPISLIVDLSNYVMLECGQPNHAYDAAKLQGGKIRVRSAGIADRLTTLDGSQPELKLGDILISDSEKAIGLAGIMGGGNSEVDDQSSEIVLEVAHFNPVSVRRTAKRLNYHTEASHRFERGVDRSACLQVAWRFATLLKDLVGGKLEISAPAIDVQPEGDAAPTRIALRLERLRDILERPDFSQERAVAILKGLNFRLVDQNPGRMVIEKPSWRLDITREIDLIEEIARIEGYENIPYSMPKISMATNHEDPYRDFLAGLKQSCALNGLSETITFPFCSKATLAKLHIGADSVFHPSVLLANPLNDEEPYLKTSLIPSLLDAVATNRRAGVQGSRLFEAGRAYWTRESLESKHKAGFSESLKGFFSAAAPRHLSVKARGETMRPIERHRMACVFDQPFAPKTWQQPEEAASFFHAKALCENLTKSLGLRNVEFEPLGADATCVPFLDPTASAWVVVDGQRIGYCGEVHPQVALAWEFDLAKAPIVLELDPECLYDRRAAQKLKFDHAIHAYPGSYRDLAFLADEAVRHSDVCRVFEALPRHFHIKSWQIFDIYVGVGIPTGKKSMAYRLTFRSKEKTLSDQEVDKELASIVASLEEQLGIQRR